MSWLVFSIISDLEFITIFENLVLSDKETNANWDVLKPIIKESGVLKLKARLEVA